MLGLYHGVCKNKLNVAREQLGQKAIDETNNKLSWQEYLESNNQIPRCEQCGKPLILLKPLINEEMNQLKSQ